MKEVGVLNTMAAAMNQSFYTHVSLGIGAMLIFGSYMGRDHALLGEAGRIGRTSTLLWLSATGIITHIPCMFRIRICTPDQGPSLIFVTLPSVFNSMAGGRIWGALFFLFMAFASITTVLPVFESVVACCMEKWNMSRKKACILKLVFSVAPSVTAVCAGLQRLERRHDRRPKLPRHGRFRRQQPAAADRSTRYIFCSAFHAWDGDSAITGKKPMRARVSASPTGSAVMSPLSFRSSWVLILVLGLI